MSGTWSLGAEIEIAREDLQRTVAAARAGDEPWQEVRRALGVVESLVMAQVKLADQLGELPEEPEGPAGRTMILRDDVGWSIAKRLEEGLPPLAEDLEEEALAAIREQVEAWAGE